MMPCDLFAPIRSLTIFKPKICMNRAHHHFAKLCMIILWLYFFIRSSRLILLPVGSCRSDMTIQETKNGLSFASRFCLCYYTLNTIFASISCLEFPNGDAPEPRNELALASQPRPSALQIFTSTTATGPPRCVIRCVLLVVGGYVPRCFVPDPPIKETSWKEFMSLAINAEIIFSQFAQISTYLVCS